MATVQDVATAVNGTGAAKANANNSASGGIQATQDRFLTLLVTQMKNQDPMNPLDNAQVTSQMAQLSTVTGIEKLNTSLEAMSASFMANQSLQASTMIGHSVLVAGSDLNLKDGAGSAGVDLTDVADKLTVTIKDGAGKVVRSIDLGAQKSAGVVPFQWDGKTDGGVASPDGKYTFSVTATQGTDKGTEKVTATTLALSKVTSVNIGTSGVSLNLANNGVVDATKVKQIF